MLSTFEAAPLITRTVTRLGKTGDGFPRMGDLPLVDAELVRTVRPFHKGFSAADGKNIPLPNRDLLILTVRDRFQILHLSPAPE